MDKHPPNIESSLDEWISWLLNLHAEEIDLGLERIRQVATSMKLLKPAPLVVTVAGTNGKGSSVAILVSILQAAGFQVGSYTSPHIQRFNERIQINRIPVADSLIVAAFDQIERHRGQTKLTYFEFSTLAALSIFKATNLDIVVLEVGLGGRLDAVNVIDADAVLITAIDIDHIDWLGDDREKIAVEKAGVMRPGRVAVCSDAQPPASLANYAQVHQVPLFQLGEDFDFYASFSGKAPQCQSEIGSGWRWVNHTLPLLPELLEGGQNQVDHFNLLTPSLKGSFQLQNAAGVVALFLLLYSKQQLPKTLLPATLIQAVNLGLKNARHPGRLQEMWIEQQYWLIDVAHNPQSAEMLVDFLEQESLHGLTAIFSVLRDKDALPMVLQLAPFIDCWLVADLQNPRAMSLDDLGALLKLPEVHRKNVSAKVSPQESIETCVSKALLLPSKVLVFGSFFTVGQVFDALEAHGKLTTISFTEGPGVESV